MRKNFGNKLVFAPLPVLVVATYDENGTPNAMNAAWGGQCDYDKVELNLSSTHKTTENIVRTRAFTISFANKENLVASDYFGIVSGHKVDKINHAGMHTHKSDFVDAPVIEEYPLTLECRVDSIENVFGGTRVIGSVVNMQADESILTDGKIDLGKLQPISFDPAANTYRVIGEEVGKAFSDGKALK